jgi:hypothetical protein
MLNAEFFHKDKTMTKTMYISKSARPWRSYAALLLGLSAVLLAALEPTMAILLGTMAVLLLFSALRVPRRHILRPRAEKAARPALPNDDPDYQLFLTADGYRLVSGQGNTVAHFGAQQSPVDAA